MSRRIVALNPATNTDMRSEDVSSANPVANRPDEHLRLASLPSGSVSRQVFILALPMLGEQVVNFLVGFVDTWLAGFVGKEATAAVGMGSYMSWFVTLGFTFVGVGAAALVARTIGGGDFKTARATLNQALVLGVLIGAVVTVIALLAAAPLSALLTQTAAAGDMMATYIRIDALGYVLFSIVLVCGGVVRSAGDTRTPMAIMIVVNIFNALVSSALVFGWFGPRLGVIGIASGTVAARTLGGVLMLIVLGRGLRGLQLRVAEMRPDWDVIRRMLRVGLPAGVEAMLMWITHMCFVFIIGRSAVGDAATVNFAAHMIGARLMAITYLPAAAWMTAAATLVGQYLGADRPACSARAAHTAAVQGGVVTLGVAVIFFVMPNVIYGMMTRDAAVRDVGGAALRFVAFMQPLLCMGIVYIGALRGAGDTRATMIISLISGLLIRVPLAYVGAIVLGGGLIGAWCGMWADNIARYLLCLIRLLGGRWKRVKV